MSPGGRVKYTYTKVRIILNYENSTIKEHQVFSGFFAIKYHMRTIGQGFYRILMGFSAVERIHKYFTVQNTECK